MSYEEQMRKNERALVLGGVMGCEKAGVAQEPNALQEENDRLKEESAHWQKQYQEAVATGALVLVRSKDQDALIKELREALKVACDWNWDAHYFEVANHFYGSEQVPAPICKQIYTALHRKV